MKLNCEKIRTIIMLVTESVQLVKEASIRVVRFIQPEETHLPEISGEKDVPAVPDETSTLNSTLPNLPDISENGKKQEISQEDADATQKTQKTEEIPSGCNYTPSENKLDDPKCTRSFNNRISSSRTPHESKRPQRVCTINKSFSLFKRRKWRRRAPEPAAIPRFRRTSSLPGIYHGSKLVTHYYTRRGALRPVMSNPRLLQRPVVDLDDAIAENVKRLKVKTPDEYTGSFIYGFTSDMWVEVRAKDTGGASQLDPVKILGSPKIPVVQMDVEEVNRQIPQPSKEEQVNQLKAPENFFCYADEYTIDLSKPTPTLAMECDDSQDDTETLNGDTYGTDFEDTDSRTSSSAPSPAPLVSESCDDPPILTPALLLPGTSATPSDPPRLMPESSTLSLSQESPALSGPTPGRYPRRKRKKNDNIFTYGCSDPEDSAYHIHLRHIRDIKITNRDGNVSYDFLTLPRMLRIAPSKIPESGKGVLTKERIEDGIVFGPYRGEKKSLNSKNSEYCWVVSNHLRAMHCVDAWSPISSNWMRYVNCCRNPEEENLVPFAHEGDIYYVTCRVIEPGEELLVWYGESFAKGLKIPLDHFKKRRNNKRIAEKRKLLAELAGSESYDQERKKLLYEILKLGRPQKAR